MTFQTRTHQQRFSLKDKLLVLRFTRLGKLPPGKYATEIFQENGLPVLVFEFDPQTNQTEHIEAPIPRIRLALGFWNRFPKIVVPALGFAYTTLFLGGKFLLGQKPKCIVAHGILEQTMARLFRFLFAIPYVVHVHEIYAPEDLSRFNKILFRFEKTVFRNAHFLIFPEKNRETLYRKRYGYQTTAYIVFNCPRFRTAGPGFDLREKFHADRNTFFVLYMGGLDRLNGVDNLILAMEHLGPNVHLILAGWALPEFQQWMDKTLDQKPWRQRVHAVGTVKEDKWDWVDSPHASFCFYEPHELRTKLQATASNKIMEAISGGVPVILYPSENFRAFAKEYAVGIVAESPTPQGIANAIQKLIDDPVAVSQMKQRAIHLHQSELNFEHQFQKALLAMKQLF